MARFNNLTRKEEEIRDALLGRFLDHILPSWVHPIHISLTRQVIFFSALFYYINQAWLEVTVILLAIVGGLDALDGSLARVRKQKTWTGSFLDHLGDWALGIFLGILVLLHDLLSPVLVLLIILPQLVIAITGFPRRKKLLLEFNPSFFSRLQFALVIFSFCFLLASVAWDKSSFALVGYIFLYGEIFTAWFLALTQVKLLKTRNRIL